MNPLIDDLIRILQRHLAVKSVRVVNYDETPAGKLEVKIRCRLVRGYHMQVWLHHEPIFQDYAYQLFADHPILRWDNTPHYPNISTAPHHFHDENTKVIWAGIFSKSVSVLANAVDSTNQQLDKAVSNGSLEGICNDDKNQAEK